MTKEQYARHCFVETYGMSVPPAVEEYQSVEDMLVDWIVVRCTCGNSDCVGWRLKRRSGGST